MGLTGVGAKTMSSLFRKVITVVLVTLLCMAVFSPLSVLAEGGDGSGGGQDEPLEFVSSSPGNGADDVSVNTSIKVAFNKNIAYYSSNTKYFSMKEAGGSNVIISVKLVNTTEMKRIAKIVPASQLKYDTEYTVTVKSGVTSKSGDVLASGKSITFTTEAAPVSSTPTATTGPATAGPTVTVSPTTTTNPAVTVSPTATATVQPGTTPKPTTTADTTGVSEPLPTESTAAPDASDEFFETELEYLSPEDIPSSGSGDNKGIPVELAASSVVNGQSGVSITEAITLTFSKNVINASVAETNKAHFALADANGNTVPIEVVMADDQLEPVKKREVVIKPLQALQAGAQYTLTISKGVQSKSGDTTQDDIAITFRTASEGMSVVTWIIIVAEVIGAATAIWLLVRRHQRKMRTGEPAA